MKRACILLVALFCLSGCVSNVANLDDDNIDVTSVEVSPTPTERPYMDAMPMYDGSGHQSLKRSAIENTADGQQIDLPEVGLKNLTIGCAETGYVTKSSNALAVYIFRDYMRYGDDIYHDSYLAVVTESKVLFRDLAYSGGAVGCYGDALYLRDVDGDGLDEIIVQELLSMTGGAGSHVSRVFKVVNDEIEEIFSSISDSAELFDTGFFSIPNGNKLEIFNRFTGYALTLDYTGKDIAHGNISCGTFCEFVPKDVDGDGVYEMLCLQYTSLNGHGDFVGYACGVLKFNPQQKKFEVVKAEFLKDYPDWE